MSAAPRLILCADDYAIAPGVSRGILHLIAHGRLTATSAAPPGRAHQGPPEG